MVAQGEPRFVLDGCEEVIAGGNVVVEFVDFGRGQWIRTGTTLPDGLPSWGSGVGAPGSAFAEIGEGGFVAPEVDLAFVADDGQAKTGLPFAMVLDAVEIEGDTAFSQIAGMELVAC